MGYGCIQLPIPGGYPPQADTADDFSTYVLRRTGGAVTNGPTLRDHALLFPPDDDTGWLWSFLMPPDAVAGSTYHLRFAWASLGTTNNVVWKMSSVGVVPSSDDLDTLSLGTVLVGSPSAVPGTSRQVSVPAFTFPKASFMPGRMAEIYLGRDANHASDTSTAHALVYAVNFEYVT